MSRTWISSIYRGLGKQPLSMYMFNSRRLLMVNCCHLKLTHSFSKAASLKQYASNATFDGENETEADQNELPKSRLRRRRKPKPIVHATTHLQKNDSFAARLQEQENSLRDSDQIFDRRKYLEYIKMTQKFQNEHLPVQNKVETSIKPLEKERSWDEVYDGVMSVLRQVEVDEEKGNTSPEYFQYLVDSVKYKGTDLVEAQSIITRAQKALPYDTGKSEIQQRDSQTPFEFDPKALAKIKPFVPARAGSFAPYINESYVLKQLLKLNVNLYKISQDRKLANEVLRMNFEKHLLPRLLFLKELGLQGEDVGRILSLAPYILTEPLEDMQVRVNYFKSKLFMNKDITQIVHSTPRMLTTPVKLIDRMLGFLQEEFELSGNEVRQLIGKHPKMFYYSPRRIKVNHIMMRDGMQLKKWQAKEMLLKFPKLMHEHSKKLQPRYEYLLLDMGLTQEQLLVWPAILGVSTFTVRKRHLFLKSLDRDQYNPKKDNFVPLRAFALDDKDFCEKIAKVPLEVMYDFIRTL